MQQRRSLKKTASLDQRLEEEARRLLTEAQGALHGFERDLFAGRGRPKPLRDWVGHVCKHDRQAKQDARQIARRLSIDKPEMFRDGDCISLTNDAGDEIFHVPLALTTA
jgi:hypothetical protein